jgi:hypothetical protein
VGTPQKGNGDHKNRSAAGGRDRATSGLLVGLDSALVLIIRQRERFSLCRCTLQVPWNNYIGYFVR